MVDIDSQLDFNILTDLIPSFLNPENSGRYGYEAIEDDLGVKLYMKVAENCEDKVRGEVIDFAKGKITEFLIKGEHISAASAIDDYFTFVDVLGYTNKLVTWDNRRIDLNEAKQAVLSSNMSEAEKAEALNKIDIANKMNNGTVAIMALSIILTVAGVTIPFPASMILPLLSMSNSHYVEDIIGRFSFLEAFESQGASFDFRWNIDPSGYLYDSETNEKITGATVTAYWIESDGSDTFFDTAPDSTECGSVWNAAEWDQVNPLSTDADGHYSWVVPEGWWRVKCEKEGYETTWSEWLPVPPPQTNVNIAMKPTVKPEYILGDADGDGEATSLDVTYIQRYLAYLDVPDSFDEDAADVDGDGEVTSIDATYVQRWLAYMDVPYDVGEPISA